jgi:hypothetical protein
MKVLTTCLILASVAAAGEPCVSGLQPGQRPGPYAAHVALGPERGKLHCYVCEAADRPVVIVFARKPTDALGKLAQAVDKALIANKAAELRGWMTFLSDDQTAADPQVVAWGKKQGLSNLPLAVFEDVDGPPAYRLTRDADVVVLLSVKQKVVHNFAFRAGELNDKAVDAVVKALPAIVKK